jgi:hypothetical protein
MPYDPNFPPTNAELISAQFRDQFHGIKDLIDTVSGITSVVVDSVTTLAPGEPASVTLGIDGSVLHMNLALPQGQPGAQGVPGVQGPPFANVVIDGVATLAPGQPATVSVSFDGTTVHLSFGIPQGAQGEQGIQGIQGAPGEVTNVAMNGAIDSAIAGTSNNTNSVPTMDTPFTNDPVTADLELMRANYNALVLALRR